MRAIDNVTLTVQRIVMPFQWLFVRLPRAFSIPLIVVAFLYFFLLFPLGVNASNQLIIYLQERLTDVKSSSSTFVWQYLAIWKRGLSLDSAGTSLAVVASLFASALMTILLAVLGVLFSYWVAGRIYMLYRRLNTERIEPPIPVPPQSNVSVNHSDNPLSDFKRIGIILSGGGAKGAYQAGAMQAIYEFL